MISSGTSIVRNLQLVNGIVIPEMGLFPDLQPIFRAIFLQTIET